MEPNQDGGSAVPMSNIRHRLQPRATAVLVVAIAAILVAAAVQPANGAQRITDVPTLEAGVLAAINAVRQEHGLPALRPSASLTSAARSHSLSMAEHGYFAHGQSLKARLAPRNGRRGYSLGETLAWASPGLSARGALRLWLRSAQHRRTLLAPGWREIGLGAVHARAAPGAFGGLDVTILTADFADRR